MFTENRNTDISDRDNFLQNARKICTENDMKFIGFEEDQEDKFQMIVNFLRGMQRTKLDAGWKYKLLWINKVKGYIMEVVIPCF